jgi:hypothetical protein
LTPAASRVRAYPCSGSKAITTARRPLAGQRPEAHLTTQRDIGPAQPAEPRKLSSLGRDRLATVAFLSVAAQLDWAAMKSTINRMRGAVAIAIFKTFLIVYLVALGFGATFVIAAVGHAFVGP